MSNKVPCFKLVILGGAWAGKTSLINAYKGEKFNLKQKQSDKPNEVTAKVELQTQNQAIEFWIWDLPGKESFIGLSRMYLRDTNAALIIYDVNDA
jgi:small GTP-binding protein